MSTSAELPYRTAGQSRRQRLQRSLVPSRLPLLFSRPQVMYFAPVIFKKFLASEMAILANLAVALVNYLSTFLALYLVDRAGRRLLLVCGGLGMALFTGERSACERLVNYLHV